MKNQYTKTELDCKLVTLHQYESSSAQSPDTAGSAVSFSDKELEIIIQFSYDSHHQ